MALEVESWNSHDVEPQEAEAESASVSSSAAHSISGTVTSHGNAATWQRSLVKAVAFTDAVVLVLAVFMAERARFGEAHKTASLLGIPISYTVLGVLIGIAWWTTIGGLGARTLTIIGNGPEEYRRLIRVSTYLFGGFAIVSLVFKLDTSRGYLAIAFPLGLILLLITRRMWRVHLARSRRRGECMSNVLVIGGESSAAEITRWLRMHHDAGFRTTGVWVPDRPGSGAAYLDVPDVFVPVMGTDRSLADALSIAEADTVIVTDTEHLGRRGLKDLNWQLESADISLMLAPNVFDVSDARVHLTDFASMTLLGVDKPKYAEAAQWPKLVFDKIGAALLILLASPLLVATAIAVKLTSSGPVFYYQERVGRDGKPFGMMKFRSMRVGADQDLHALLLASGQSGPLGKLKRDPRVTRVGGVIRRYSIDELPQLFNVLRGDMSLVGPRPQRQFEVDTYDEVAHRRLRVRPGMTGLWQVSGRSDLSWDEAIRLDTYYVENWSMVGDIRILWRTVKAVMFSEGAY